jgi:hypothetical protein
MLEAPFCWDVTSCLWVFGAWRLRQIVNSSLGVQRSSKTLRPFMRSGNAESQLPNDAKPHSKRTDAWTAFFLAQKPKASQCRLLLEVSRSYIETHHSQQDSSRRVIGPSQRPLSDNTQHLQQADIHVPDGIRTRNPSKTLALDSSTTGICLLQLYRSESLKTRKAKVQYSVSMCITY